MISNARVELWRAAADDLIVGSASFARRREHAECYLDNPGFGGPNLYRCEVEIDEARVLDLLDADDALEELCRVAGTSHPGSTTADQHAPRIADELQAAGVSWVRVLDTFPEGCETWIFVGPSDEDPEMQLADD